jgi:Glycosyl hydrolase catalytic core
MVLYAGVIPRVGKDPNLRTRLWRILWAGAALSLLLATVPRPPATHAAPAADDATRADLFGMVARDPYYEYNSDPQNFPNAPNRVALERQAAELQEMGVKWVRMEFFAEGEINWDRYDLFINDIAPRHGLKVLGLLNAGIVSYEGGTVDPSRFNDPADQDDGSNHYIRVFRWRAQQIAQRYGAAISAYEVVNEPNINYELWNSSNRHTAEIKPERYATLLTMTYRNIKTVVPDAQVLIGGMLLGPPPNDNSHDELDWLYQLYVAPAVQAYQASGDAGRPGWNVVPWDGVGLHPYWVDAGKFQQLVRAMAQKLRDRGDLRSRIWVTEIGMEAKPAPANAPPSDAEVAQASFLTAVYRAVLDDPQLRQDVHTIFWFKYEDFPAPRPAVNFGLVRLAETASGYAPSGDVTVHKLAYRAYQALARPGGLPESRLEGQALAQNRFYFPATGQAIAPEFQAYWESKGGLPQFGYPLTQPTLIRGYRTQIFERAVFEYHPENAPPFDVLLRRLGAETLTHAYPEAQPFPDAPDRHYFPETHHSLGGKFLEYWLRTGGLAVYGYPLSEEVQEFDPRTSTTYTVQYFERNRFEYHPENAGTPYEIQLGLLGGDLLQGGLWWR